ncbi:hypothetical protein HY642_01740 [Candidatus Woesearchaeota archaeon]|nr:hypothetical protein [Candidatus Woesearchaeota archaeon]
MTNKQLVKPDKEAFLALLEEKAARRRSRTLNPVLDCEKRLYGRLGAGKTIDHFASLDKAFADCAYTEADIILHYMPDKLRAGTKYTATLDKYLGYVHREFTGDKGWQPCKAAIVEEMACHHPNRDIRLTALEILVSHDIGSGVGEHDIGMDLCWQTNCKYIFTEYYSMQEFEGYWVHDTACPVHGNIFYNDEDRYKLMTKWHKIVSKDLNKVQAR